jgi:enoyl-CoA hydratase/carnithine racemase
VRDDDAVRVAVVTAAGERHFCTGFDVGEAEGDEADSVFANRPLAEAVHWSPHQNRVWKPVLCACQGLCVGGGLHFVVDSDIVIASENAAFMDTHVNVGMVGAIENVGPRQAPAARLGAAHDALRAATTDARAPRLRARSGRRAGREPADALPAALAIAEQLLGNSPQAMALSKQSVWGSLEQGYAGCARVGVEPAAPALELTRTSARARGFRGEARAALDPEPESAERQEVKSGVHRRGGGVSRRGPAFLADYRDLDAFFLQGHHWPRVRAFFTAMAERGWLSLGWPVPRAAAASRSPTSTSSGTRSAMRARRARRSRRGSSRRRSRATATPRSASAGCRRSSAARPTSRSPTPSPRPAPTSRPRAAAPSCAAASTSCPGRSAGSRTRRTWTTSGRSCARQPGEPRARPHAC